MKIINVLPDTIQESSAPWNDVVLDETHVIVYRDRYPCTPGHLLFVPKVNNPDNIMDCFRLAHRYGEWVVLKGDADGYNIGMNSREAAGQTVMYPHIHMIPRRNGDCADPVGGVRGVIAGQANYKTGSYNNPTK
jgi:diadenosine tetraphosphate (Ap4A) HIT family hydrolase